MSIATLANIEKTFGKRVIFNDLSLTVYPGERIGLIGANGAGKTTLFKVLMGQVIPDRGSVAVAKSTKVGYLTQDPTFDPANSVMDEAELAFSELHKLSHRLRDLEHEMANREGEELERILKQYQATQHDFDVAGGYAWRHRLEATLLGVGLDRNTWEQNVQTLSGGQRSRLSLARLLISEPDLLLLDEPTNHLDLAAIQWLEQYLLDFKGAVVLVSHDRYLLDRLATRIVWLTQYKLFSYPGNYSAFVQQRELQELTQQRAYDEQQAEIEKQAEYIRRFKAGQRARQAKGREKRLERMLTSDSMVKRLDVQKHIHLSLNTDQRAGDQVLHVTDLSKAYDTKELWQSITFNVRRGERIGVIGPNGSGKTTLLEVIQGRRDADAGDIRWGANLHIGYYDQRLDDFDPANTVLEEVGESSDAKEQELRDMLATMLFRGEDIHKPMSVLSGGERARVALVQLLLDKPNVLILDEPTNHLDIASREALEAALTQFPGTILCVSHDRYFLDKVATRLLILQPPRIRDFSGNYSAWQRKHAEEAQAAAAAAEQKTRAKPAAAPVPPAKPRSNADNPYKRPFGRMTLEQLEKEIDTTEAALAECNSMFSQSFKDPAQAQKLQSEYDDLVKKLEQLEEEYFAREI